jgi:hypothetical protein
VTLATSAATPVVEPYTLSCVNDDTVGGGDGAAGMGEDTDLDGLIDEDRIDGVDNDGDTLVDEDSGYLLPTVCVINSIGFNPTWQPVIDGHISDQPGEQRLGSAGSRQLPDGPVRASLHPELSVVQDEEFWAWAPLTALPGLPRCLPVDDTAAGSAC